MKRIIVYGTGQVWKELRGDLPRDAEIIAYGDSHKERSTQISGETIEGKPIYTPDEIVNIDFDEIHICTNSDSAYDIRKNLMTRGIEKNRIKLLFHNYIADEWKCEYDSEGNIIHSVSGIRVRERFGNKSDYQTIGELFVTNCYGIDICHANTVVVDMGMNIGLASLLFANNKNVKRVYSYEPFKDTYEAALFNIKLNPDISYKIHPFNCAVSDFNGGKDIYVLTEFAGGRTTELEYAERVYAQNEDKNRKEHIEYKDAKEVLNEIISENEGNHFVLKIDTEGSEFPIFESISKSDSLLKKVDSIVMEYHRLPDILQDILRKNGFLCISPGNKNIGLIYAIRIRG